MSIELPPLPEMESCATKLDENGYEAWSVDGRIMVHEARERILLARIAELEGYVEGYQGIVGRMEADAARYRWLRGECDSDRTPSDCWILEAPGDAWDAAIDAAMAKETKP